MAAVHNAHIGHTERILTSLFNNDEKEMYTHPKILPGENSGIGEPWVATQGAAQTELDADLAPAVPTTATRALGGGLGAN